MITRRHMTALLAAAFVPVRAGADEPIKVTLYKNPQCGCCEGHARYLRRGGFAVTEIPSHDLSLIRRERGVPEALEGCHVILVGDYIVEGHVPAGPIKRLLAERPKIKGISLPGMPTGSPGMDGPKTGPFIIYEIADGGGEPKVFARE